MQGFFDLRLFLSRLQCCSDRERKIAARSLVVWSQTAGLSQHHLYLFLMRTSQAWLCSNHSDLAVKFGYDVVEGKEKAAAKVEGDSKDEGGKAAGGV